MKHKFGRVKKSVGFIPPIENPLGTPAANKRDNAFYRKSSLPDIKGATPTPQKVSILMSNADTEYAGVDPAGKANNTSMPHLNFRTDSMVEQYANKLQ